MAAIDPSATHGEGPVATAGDAGLDAGSGTWRGPAAAAAGSAGDGGVATAGGVAAPGGVLAARGPAAGGPGSAEGRLELTERALGYARSSRAAATWRAYEARWARFMRWCAAHGERAYPADPLAICRFLADLAPLWRPATPDDPLALIVAGHVLVRPGLRPGTVAGYLAAISVAHQAGADPMATPTISAAAATEPHTGELTGGQLVGGHPGAATAAAALSGPNPARHEMVGRVLAGITRHPTVTPARRRTALRPGELRAILAALATDQRLADARDAALLLVGWKAALRADDLARLDITDLVVCEDGLTVHLRRSKTDQAAAGVAVGITGSADPDDPLDALAAWARWRDRLASHGLHTGPAWRGVDRYGRRPRAGRLTTKSIDAIITHRATAAGLDGDYGGHSLRRGFATSALAGGATERAVQHHGRWRSPTSMTPYIDEATRFDTTNPTRFLT